MQTPFWDSVSAKIPLYVAAPFNRGKTNGKKCQDKLGKKEVIFHAYKFS